eukprot:s859_g21.t1
MEETAEWTFAEGTVQHPWEFSAHLSDFEKALAGKSVEIEDKVAKLRQRLEEEGTIHIFGKASPFYLYAREGWCSSKKVEDYYRDPKVLLHQEGHCFPVLQPDAKEIYELLCQEIKRHGRELSEAQRRRSPSSESTISSSFLPTAAADASGVEELIRELRQCQEERTAALKEASSALSEAHVAEEKFREHQSKIQGNTGHMVEEDGKRVELLRRELEIKRQSCQKLRKRLEMTRKEKDAVTQSCLAGVEAWLLAVLQDVALGGAAHMQMMQMRDELDMLTQAPSEEQPRQGSPKDDEELAWRQLKLLECRNLRHDLSKWRHQVATLENKRPGDEAEVRRLKAEVLVERHVREKAEERGSHLARKAKRLAQVLLAQRLLIQCLEKQLLIEESQLEQKDLRLAGEEKLHLRLKVALRQRSDEIVVDRILGKLSIPRKEKMKVKKAIDETDTPKSNSKSEAT